jgi:hypothetical protein
MSANIDELAAVYLAVRGMRDEAKAEFEAKDEEMKSDMAQLEAAMLAICNEMGNINSINTSSGTVMRTLKERYNCGDWDAFNKFVLEHKAPELFEKRIHQGNMKEFLKSVDDGEGPGLPPGVSVFREYNITVRKPSK